MKSKAFVALIATVAVLMILVQSRSRTGHRHSETEPSASLSPESPTVTEPKDIVAPARPAPSPLRTPLGHNPVPGLQPDRPIQATDKLDRLREIRDRFQVLAAGDPSTALRAARQIDDPTERETALLALVAQWTHGELRRPLDRARSIDNFGLEAGLGLELARQPELAIAWANELTDGPGRVALLRETALALTSSDPAAAFALGEQLPDQQRRQFFDSLFARWGGKDTEAALQWANQLPDPDQREQAVQAIRTEAPVGIGTSVTMKDGFPVVMQLIPGSPAEASGKIQPGDRILALAQGDNSFVNAQGIPLKNLVDMIRGAPGTTLQLQILPADAPPDSAPQTISITRDQLKFKH